MDFLDNNHDYDMHIIFAVLDEDILKLGMTTLNELSGTCKYLPASCRQVNWFARTLSYMYADHDRIPYQYFESSGFVDEGLACLGFDMDCGKSFCKIFELDSIPSEPDELKRYLHDPRMTVWLLGTLIFSYWRYWNHWACSALKEKDFEWFAIAFARLAELAREET